MMGAAILPLLGMASRTTSEKGRGPDSPGFRNDFAGLAMFSSEGPEFAFDYLFGAGSNICQLVINDLEDICIDLLECDTAFRQHLDTCHEREIDRLTDLGEQPDIHLFDTVDISHALAGDLCGEEIVDL